MVRFGLLSSSSNELEFLECSPFPSQPGFGGPSLCPAHSYWRRPNWTLQGWRVKLLEFRGKGAASLILPVRREELLKVHSNTGGNSLCAPGASSLALSLSLPLTCF